MTADEKRMRRALELAAQGPRGVNPQVGCVIADDTGVIAEGFHRGAGTPHAEVEALAVAGDRARGATAYVTLEPCAHTGRTGPCATALITAGVSRVVYALADPTPDAAGGARMLSAAGIATQSGLLEDEASALLHDWLHARSTQRPFIVLKIATSLDGRVDDALGKGRRLTGEPAAAYVQALRAGSDAVMVGIGTVLADNPRLTVRDLTEHGRIEQPWRVVLGHRAVPGDALVRGADQRFLQFLGGALQPVLQELAGRGIARVLVEGGPTLASSLLSGGFVDEVHWLTAPILLGQGPIALAGNGSSALPRINLDVRSVEVIGEDVCIVGRPHGNA